MIAVIDLRRHLVRESGERTRMTAVAMTSGKSETDKTTGSPEMNNPTANKKRKRQRK
jgi:hypothetical protein